MTFFVDHNLSPHLASGMRAFQEEIIHLSERFPTDAKDPDWLPVIAREGLILITRDDHIRWKPAELGALRKSGVGAFFLGGKNRSRCDLIQQIVRNWPRMKELASSTRRPFAFRVPPVGTKFDRLPV
jgi:predicted nuclease of predicted toxin-antitoxin system